MDEERVYKEGGISRSQAESEAGKNIIRVPIWGVFSINVDPGRQ